jgi:multicomponent Na+:H+ antiporter subunit B
MTSVLTRAVARLMLAPTLVIAVAVLVKGYADVGDGFSAGVIAAVALLLQYLAFGREATDRALRLQVLGPAAFAGLLAALLLAAWPLLRGDPVFTQLPAPGVSPTKLGTLELITAVAFDVAVFVLVLGAVVGTIRAVAMAGEEDPG